MKKDNSQEADFQEEKDKMIKQLKKEVKALMEESVAKKTVHEESSNVTAVCSTVDTCLSLGLRRRALGLFKTSSTSALLQKISKENEDAQAVLQRIEEINGQNNKRIRNGSEGNIRTIQKVDSSSNLVATMSNRFFWIRIALFEKKLHHLVSYLVSKSDRYYDNKRSLVADPDFGPILSSLLVGPCALEYTRLKSGDQYWNDPPADELVMRHRISSGSLGSQPSTPLKNTFKKTLSSQGFDYAEERRSSIPHQAREYVESLHQNNRIALLYGKNNVHVLPNDWSEPLPGYLSLHQISTNITLKWTPNQLMGDGRSSSSCFSSATWNQALTITIRNILYLHCHEDTDQSGTLIMIGGDGIQYPPMNFPPGDSLTQFLGCLESALLPRGMLDPPLWSDRKSKLADARKRSRRKRFSPLKRDSESDDIDSEDGQILTKDSVFKITYLKSSSIGDFNSCQDEEDDIHGGHERLHKAKSVEWFANIFNINKKTNGSLTSSDTLSINESEESDHAKESIINGVDESDNTGMLTNPVENDLKEEDDEVVEEKPIPDSPNAPIRGLCHTMRRQIISRAFYGWLAHCRHLNTVRNHLQGLVNNDISTSSDEWNEGLTEEVWYRLKQDGSIKEEDQMEIYKRVYFGGTDHHLRKEVWQFLLGHLDWGDGKEEIAVKDRLIRCEYENKISEWGALEAIVAQNDKETTAANIARLSTEASLNMSNEVFESMDSDHSQEGEYPNCSTPERPSTITEVTEHSSRTQSHSKQSSTDRSSKTSISSTSSRSIERKIEKEVPWKLFVSASDEGIEDINDEDINDLNEDKHDDEDDDDIVLDHTLGTKISYKITTPSVDSGNPDSTPPEQICPSLDYRSSQSSFDQQLSQEPGSPNHSAEFEELTRKINNLSTEICDDLLAPATVSTCPSPASSEGTGYDPELLESFGLNLHRIDKDVQRCDRNIPYFTPRNLDKLRNIITTYVWDNLETGYMQGMCDLVAPLLVVIDDEAIVFSCFSKLMKRMIGNFPTGTQMDDNFANMRALMQVLDQGLYDKIQQNGDFSHFYFCYRWFLLDFKREFCYSDVYLVWEAIWAAGHVASNQFFLFIALGLVESYRDIILDRNMDFTDIIKFFNEMAERHEAKSVLQISRDLVDQLHCLIIEK